MSTNRPPEMAIDPHKLGRSFTNTQASDKQGRRTLRFHRGEWWRWESGRYRVVSSGELKAELTRFIKLEIDTKKLVNRFGNAYTVSGSLVNNVVQAIAGELLVADSVDVPIMLGGKGAGQFLAFENGLVGLEGVLGGQAELKPHTPEWFSPVVFPYAFDAGASSPRWVEFLDHVLENDSDRLNLVQEWCGYCLIPDTSLHKFMVLEGDGANGKSVFLEVLGALLGEENISHVPLGVFGDRFQLTPTVGKLANIAPEADEDERPNLGVLKQFTAGDRMYLDRKGISGIQVKPTARLVLATNNRPPLGDRSQGLWRRLLLVPFRVSIPENQQDRELARKLRCELPGIVNWALEGLVRLRQRGHFTESQVGLEALKEYRLESNPARIFLSDYCSQGTGVRVRVDEVYDYYKSFCRSEGFTALNGKAFGKEVRRQFPRVQRTRPVIDGRRTYVYDGLGCSYLSGGVNAESDEEFAKAA